MLFNNNEIKEIESLLQHHYHNTILVETAFTHSSFANIKHIKSNERLEFLGDTLLSTVISEKIYADMDTSEGELSKLRSRIVSMKPLAMLVENLGVDKYLKYVGAITDNMKADLMEAIIASIYLDSGMEQTKKFIFQQFGETVRAMEHLTVFSDPKSQLQEKLKNSEIKYTCSKTGADHEPSFLATVFVNGVVCGKGIATTKKEAEKKAASECLKNLNKV